MRRDTRNFDDKHKSGNKVVDNLVDNVLNMLDTQILYKQQMERKTASFRMLFGFAGDIESSKGFIGSILRYNMKSDQELAGIAAIATGMMSEDLSRAERELFYQQLVFRLADRASRANTEESRLLNDTIDLIINNVPDRELTAKLCELSLRKSRD